MRSEWSGTPEPKRRVAAAIRSRNAPTAIPPMMMMTAFVSLYSYGKRVPGMMFAPNEFRRRATIYRKLAAAAGSSTRQAEYASREESLNRLADNEQWLADNHEKVLGIHREPATPEGEEHMLRCLGAAVLLQWGELPQAIQRALFDAACSLGDPEEVAITRARIANFLHERRG